MAALRPILAGDLRPKQCIAHCCKPLLFITKVMPEPSPKPRRVYAFGKDGSIVEYMVTDRVYVV